MSQSVYTPPGELQSPGTGPFFGEKTYFAKKRPPENMDLSPSRQDFAVLLYTPPPTERAGNRRRPNVPNFGELDKSSDLSYLAVVSITVHRAGGDWSIFRPTGVHQRLDFARKHGPVPFPPAERLHREPANHHRAILVRLSAVLRPGVPFGDAAGGRFHRGGVPQVLPLSPCGGCWSRRAAPAGWCANWPPGATA